MSPELGKRLQQRARERRLSLNRATIELLEEVLLADRKRPEGPPFHDMDFLAGGWTEAEAREFDRALAEQRKIEKEMWR
jgi:hypothetical protein